MSNRALVTYTRLSPNCTKPRTKKIKKITPHHMAGNLTLEQLGELWARPARRASSNYGIDSEGRIGLYVDEANRAWTSGSAENDNQAVTIEIANDSGAPEWHISDKALAATIDLCVDICKRNGIKKLNFNGKASGTLTMHRYFEATLCPGPYLAGKFTYIADEVNRRLNAEKKATKFLPDRGYFKLGDKHKNVGKIATFMRKMFPSYTPEKALGNTYGPYLQGAVKEFQKRTGLEPDGFFGPLTLAMLEEYGFKV